MSTRILYVGADDERGPLETALFRHSTRLEAPTVETISGSELCDVAAEANDVDAVIVEHDLGSTTGVSLAESLRNDRPDLPVILYPRTLEADVVEAATGAGVTDIVHRTATDGSRRLLVATLDSVLAGGGEGRFRPTVTPQFWSIADTTSDCIVTIDTDSIVRFVNPAVQDLFGYEPDELRGEPLTKLMDDDHAERHLGAIDRYLETQERAVDWNYVELTGQHEDGHDVPLSVSFSEFTQDGKRFFTGIMRDISERRRRERERNERAQQQRAIAQFGQYALGQRDIDEVLIRATELVADLLDHDYCEILNHEPKEDTLHHRISVGWNGDLAGEGAIEMNRETQAGHALRSNEPVVVTDFETEDRFGGRDLSESRDAASGICVSVGAVDVPWGVLGTYDGEPNDYSEHDVQFVQTIANILGNAIARHEHETQLRALTEELRRLPDAETTIDLCESVISTAERVVDLDTALIGLYDPDRDGFQAVAETQRPDAVDALLADDASNPVWRSFVRDEQRVVTADDPDELPLGEALAVWPLGRHGVLIAIGDRPDAFNDLDVTLTDILVANTRSALDRVSREEDLRDQRDVLAEKTDSLQRVNRVNRAIRAITQELIRADTTDEVYEQVCEQLAGIDPHRFTWIAREGIGEGELTVAASAGDGEGYLDAAAITTDASEVSSLPSRRAFETNEPQVQNTIFTDPPIEPWREAALDRGFRASVAVPITYNDRVYGVLNIYADETGAFDQLEVAVLRELGETIGYAVDALARKKALVGDSSVELKFRIANLEAPFLGFVDGTQGSFELESIVQRSDGHIHVFFTLTGVSPDSVLADAGASTAVVDSTLVTETDDGGVYECTLATATFLPNVLERGVNLHTLLVDDGTASIGLRIPKTADVRNFIETFQDEFGTVELVTRREVDQPVMSADEFKNTVRERLTARQEEVVQTAYFSGFFEWPRESTGGEVADILGVTQPTVNRHIRAGERTLFGLVYEDHDADVQGSVDTR